MKKMRMLSILAVVVLLLVSFCGCSNVTMDELNSMEGQEDLYADTAISKTEAVTDGGIPYYEENKISVISYNVRCSNDSEGHSVKERAPRMEMVLKAADADLIGFQEVTVEWMNLLDEMLGEDYGYVLKFRAKNSKEGTPIFYKKSKFKLLDSGYFWLSETPEEESKGWDADYYRICSWVKLEVRQTGAVVYYFNTHYDFEEAPQMGSSWLILQKISEMAGDSAAILTADFNMEQDAAAYQLLTTKLTDVNMATTKDLRGTYQNYGVVSKLIDFCFVTPESVLPVNYRLMDEKPYGHYVSDHYGIYNEVIILEK